MAMQAKLSSKLSETLSNQSIISVNDDLYFIFILMLSKGQGNSFNV